MYANTYVSYSSDSTFPTTNTLTLSGMTVGQSLTVSTDNSNSITVNDDTPGNINNRKVKCRDSIPAMSGGRISSGNPDYQFELYYQSTQINCATTASSFFFSSQTGPQTANLTPMTLRLVKVGSSGSTATITYPTFQMCNLDTSTSDSSGACFTGTPTGQLVRYTPTTSFATVVVNQAPVVDANQNFIISDNDANNTSVGTVTASDSDGDPLQNWQITNDTSGGVFTINSSTGVIRVGNNTNLLPGTWTLSVTVDDDQGSTSAVQTVTIFVDVAAPTCTVNEIPTSGYADTQTNTGVTNPDNALGAPDGTFAQLAASDILTLDLTDTVPENEVIYVIITRNNSAGLVTIEGSADDVTYGNAVQYGNGLGAGTIGDFETISYSAPAGGVRYLRFTRDSGQINVEAVAYSYCAVPPNSA
ncbi:MAG: cadherin repeat domain-containing protein, partial [Caldilineaceae bacterium]|nr:cadherin repeat domain-containing protein [Caldilineaceae bacterium]